METEVDKFIRAVKDRQEIDAAIRHAMTTPEIVSQLIEARVVNCSINYRTVERLHRSR